MSRKNRVRKLINLDIKKEIIFKRESGKSLGDLNAEYGMANSMISTIKKIKGRNKKCTGPKRVSMLSISRCNITEQIATLLLVWINEKQMTGDSVSEAIVCKNFKKLFEELCAKAPSKVLVL